ncbi:MAG: riboflavin synthase [Candidatus Omnitrophota bacterium]
MFTGIVKGLGAVKEIISKKNLIVLKVDTGKLFKKISIGDSIAIDGVCLTATSRKSNIVSFDVMKETISCTTLKYLKSGSKVNLEEALRANSPLGGHFVSGHVDCVGKILEKITQENYVEFQIAISKDQMRYIVPKGSVSVDGISLTVGKVWKNYFSIYIIPHTLKITTLGFKVSGDEVNIETDLLAKYFLKQK